MRCNGEFNRTIFSSPVLLQKKLARLVRQAPQPASLTGIFHVTVMREILAQSNLMLETV